MKSEKRTCLTFERQRYCCQILIHLLLAMLLAMLGQLLVTSPLSGLRSSWLPPTKQCIASNYLAAAAGGEGAPQQPAVNVLPRPICTRLQITP